jgi:hypothetical protein
MRQHIASFALPSVQLRSMPRFFLSPGVFAGSIDCCQYCPPGYAQRQKKAPTEDHAASDSDIVVHALLLRRILTLRRCRIAFIQHQDRRAFLGRGQLIGVVACILLIIERRKRVFKIVLGYIPSAICAARYPNDDSTFLIESHAYLLSETSATEVLKNLVTYLLGTFASCWFTVNCTI